MRIGAKPDLLIAMDGGIGPINYGALGIYWTKYVFTSAYHRKRGYCCNCKCRHCPYGADAPKEPTIQLVGLPLKPPARGGGPT